MSTVSESIPAKRRWPRADALIVAMEICMRLAPKCERIVIAGSLRRRKPAVGDIEILYIPRMEDRPADLLFTRKVSVADEEIDIMLADGTLSKRPSKIGTTAWGARNKFALHESGIPVDLFRTTPQAWWNYLVCRTGPAESNMLIASEARRRGYTWEPYGTGFVRGRDGETFAMESEERVFAFVGLPYLTPDKR